MSGATIFPPVELANEDGIVALGGDLHPETLISAYLQGIFPWPVSKEWPLAWFSPDPRGVVPTDQFHIPRKLKKFLNNSPFTIKYNTRFEDVIHECANCNNRPGQTDTWITTPLSQAYIKLHQMGLAYSVETFHHDQLVGGVYGVCLGKIISAESMFYKKPNASKAALTHLVKHLNKNGIEWIDIQMVTPITKSLGGIEIPRPRFLEHIYQLQNCQSSDEIFPKNLN